MTNEDGSSVGGDGGTSTSGAARGGDAGRRKRRALIWERQDGGYAQTGNAGSADGGSVTNDGGADGTVSNTGASCEYTE